jgi:hypothetical protein
MLRSRMLMTRTWTASADSTAKQCFSH